MIEKKNTSITFRAKPELKELINLIGKRESRNLSLQIEYFLKIAIRDYLDENKDLVPYYNKAFDDFIPDTPDPVPAHSSGLGYDARETVSASPTDN
jgi:predicted DNA-binding protein